MAYGTYDLLALTVTPQVFNTLSTIPFVMPVNPGTIPPIIPSITWLQVTAAVDQHKRQKTIFYEVQATNSILKSILLNVWDDIYFSALKNQYIGYNNVTILQLLTHLYDNYGDVNDQIFEDNDKEIKYP